MRFEEKDATVRYVPGKVTLDRILERYRDTPFEVAPAGPIVTVARGKNVTLRAWSHRAAKTPPSDPPEKKPAGTAGKEAAPRPIQVLVDVVPAEPFRIASPPALTLADPPAPNLGLMEKPGRLRPEPSGDKGGARRFTARLAETVTLTPGEITVPVTFHVTTVDANEKKHDDEGRFDVVLRTEKAKPSPDSEAIAGGAALIGGTLQLRLGHLCDQKGCVEHFHASIREVPGLGAVRPHPDLKNPQATVYLRAHQAIDVWALRESLRAKSVEISGMAPEELDGCRLRVELPRWRKDEKSPEVRQCMECRERTVQALTELPWADVLGVSGGGINLRPTRSDLNLVELLDAITRSHRAPRAVWLVPAGVPLPKASPPRLAKPRAAPKKGGSENHPVVELDLAHTCEVGTDMLALLEGQKWASRTQVRSENATLARAAIADRKFAALTPLLNELSAAGQVPKHIRLREFADIRIQIEFDHICGAVVYSKPPKPKKKDPKKKAATKKAEPEKKPKQQKRPFVPKPLRPAETSNGRKAIEAAVAGVAWIKNGVFAKHHTRPRFSSTRKLFMSLEAKGEDVILLDPLVQALRDAGFPPKSVIVSRLFAGIPFDRPLPGDVEVTDQDGKKLPLLSLKKAGRPLAVAFVSLKSPPIKKKKYTADPKHYLDLGKTIDAYKDRVDFVAVSANKKDEFAEVVKFWAETGVSAPLLHDASGQVRAVFNSQVTPAPHLFVFGADGRLRYGGDPHDNWGNAEKPKDDYLAKALDLVLAGKYLGNGAVFYNKSVCNCSHPKCKCPKCGCGSTCRCGSRRCGVGFGRTK